MELHCLDNENEDKLHLLFATKIDSLIPNAEGTFFVGYQYHKHALPIGASFGSLMVFYSTDYHESETFDCSDFLNSSREEYQVEDVEIFFGDFCKPTALDGELFSQKWKSSIF